MPAQTAMELAISLGSVCPPTVTPSWHKEEEKGRRKEEGRKKEGKSYLSLKSRDHHLAGGEFQQPPPNFPEIAGMHELYPK